MNDNILIVDDDPVIRILISEYLSSLNLPVELCENGQMCLDYLEQNTPTLVVLDLQMPDINGIEVLKCIRANKTTESLPVIMLSANSDTEPVVKKHGVSADIYLQKPFEMKDLLEAVQSILELSQAKSKTYV